jgi:hypothetical protein
VKLYTHQLPAPPDNIYIEEAYRWKRRGAVKLYCAVDGDNIYHLGDPRFLAALVEVGALIEFIVAPDYSDLSDPYTRAALDMLIEEDFGTPDNPKGNVYEISDRPEDGKVYCKLIR